MSLSARIGIAGDGSQPASSLCPLPWQRWQRGHLHGQKLNVKTITTAKVQAAFSGAEMQRAIKEGVKTNGKETMKPFGNKFSDTDIKALVVYIRSFNK